MPTSEDHYESYSSARSRERVGNKGGTLVNRLRAAMEGKK